MSSTEDSRSVVKSAGRGVIYITVAKLWFMLSGIVMMIILPWVFKKFAGDDEAGMALFGAYGLVFTGVSFFNNPIVTGSIQSVSKFTSEDESQAGAVRRTALKLQGGFGVLLAMMYAAVAGPIAERWIERPELADLMRLSSGVMVAYSLYAVFIGSFNGRRMFHRQAGFDIVYTTFKMAAIIGFVLLGYEVLGTVIGFLIASFVIAIAAGFASRGGGGGSFNHGRYARFAGKLFGYHLILNLLMMVDIYLMAGLVDPDASQVLAGQYSAVQRLSFIPYQAVIAIAFVIFPLISKVTAGGDNEKARVYVRKTMRFTAILSVGLACVFSALPTQAITLLFPPEYAVAAPALRILPMGIAAFGLMVVGNTVLTGAGHPWRAIVVVILGLGAVAGAIPILVKFSGLEPLTASALGTTIGMAVGLLGSGLLVHRRFGTFWPWATALRVAMAGSAVIAVGHFLPVGGRILTMVECGGVLAFFFALLFILREFGAEDLSQFKQVFKRG